jgi:two-component sensor histidine kinase
VNAYGFAVLCVAIATAARFAVGWLGADLPFATYFPAVLIVAVVAGPAAATVAIALTVAIVWWVFMPRSQPVGPFAFGRFTFADVMNTGLFLIAAFCIVYIAEKYRQSVQRLRNNERARQLEMRELEHRGKNTFAVVESIVRKTLEDSPDKADVIAGRIHAISSTNDIINRSEGHTATLDTILVNEFTPYDLARVTLDGPTVELDANTARAMALVIHELITNAAKYGALSATAGRVEVKWKQDGKLVEMDWSESGGPEVTAPATRADYGFGSRLIVQTLKSLSGSVVPQFDRSGLKCHITFQV